jgi:hypothetical protein
VPENDKHRTGGTASVVSIGGGVLATLNLVSIEYMCRRKDSYILQQM